MNDFYKLNKNYAELLEKIPVEYYEKYIFNIEKFLKSANHKFLDIGCGIGTVVDHLNARNLDVYGVDVSDLFVNYSKARSNNLGNKIFTYDGLKLPFESCFFDVCGSFNVLEHVDDPLSFIKEMNRVLKKSGIGIIVCPNFLSVFFRLGNLTTNSFRKRLLNLFKIIKMIYNKTHCFEKMKMIEKPNFEEDDDAIVKTNIISIINLLKLEGNEIIHVSGVTKKYNFFVELVSSFPFFRLLLTSCFVIYRK